MTCRGCVKTAEIAIDANMEIRWISQLSLVQRIYIKPKLVFIAVDVICKHLQCKLQNEIFCFVLMFVFSVITNINIYICKPYNVK